ETLLAVGLLFGLVLSVSAEDKTLHSFVRKQLSNVYLSEGANGGDLNHDGHVDVVYGPYWYEGPAFETKHELYPAKPQCQLVGLFSRELCPVFAEILQRLGRDSAWVVYGTTGDGRSVDEVSLMGSTRICKSGLYQDIEDEEVRPRDFGLKHAEVESLRGGDAKTNAAILEAILSGKDSGPKRDMVLMNSGAALACAGLADNMGDGIEISREMITSGAAMERLNRLRKASARH
ncbi:MAG: hypothetical protein H8M99_02990, partial [Gloeobacteraceae cyanobacterium ES-bin-144]|nr:hypothetical protein [Verrucomicrobiales bacterium]